MGRIDTTTAEPTLAEVIAAIVPSCPGLTPALLASAIRARGRPALSNGRIVGGPSARAEAFFAAMSWRDQHV